MSRSFPEIRRRLALGFILMLGVACTSLARAGGELTSQATGCGRPNVDTVSLFIREDVTSESDPGVNLDAKVASLNQLAQKLSLGDFKILAQNFSVSAGYGNRFLSVDYSLTVEFASNSKAIKPLTDGMDTHSYALSRSSVDLCSPCSDPGRASTSAAARADVSDRDS